MYVNNEMVGISAEVAIAREFNVPIDSDYVARADEEVVNVIRLCVKGAFRKYNIPTPIKHIAQGQNPIDFMLNNGKTLSVKSNQGRLSKVAPQVLGQPTAKTYFDIIGKELNYNVNTELHKHNLNDNYESRAYLFKELSMNRTKDVLNIYWRYMFDCDYLIHFYNVVSSDGFLLNNPKYVVFGKLAAPAWNASQFSFTQTLESWNESCTLKYNGYSIGEFQVHKHRNCFKFRFNMDNIMCLLEKNLL